MLSTLDKNAVESFLKLCKSEIKKGNRKFISLRKVVIKSDIMSAYDALYSLGIKDEREMWNYILNLEVKDCIDVSFDYDAYRDYNTEMYEFIIYINNTKVYIKLTYRNKVICLSFHESNY
ncbi:MAG: hypothetical protein ACLUFU_03390 [Bacilli bacterium]